MNIKMIQPKATCNGDCIFNSYKEFRSICDYQYLFWMLIIKKCIEIQVL